MSEVGASTHVVAAGGHEIDEGLAVIGPGVEQLVTDVVAPLLPGLVGPVVNEVVEPVVEHSVEPIVGAVVEPLEKLVAEVPSLLTRMGPG